MLRALLLASLLFLLSACSPLNKSQEGASNRSALATALKMPLPAVAGQQMSLAQFQGKVVLLHFLASWCRECAAEAASLNGLQASFKGTPFSVVGIATDDDPFQMQVFASRHNLQFPVLHDATGELKAFFGVRSIPTTIFLGKNGTPIRFADPSSGEILVKMEGARQWDSPHPVEMIAALVEEK